MRRRRKGSADGGGREGQVIKELGAGGDAGSGQVNRASRSTCAGKDGHL
jgi:hypothetical protein